MRDTLFSALGSWGLFKQSQRIWREQSGIAVPARVFLLAGATSCTGFIYGMHIHSLAMILSGLSRFPLNILVVMGIWKFRGFDRGERVLSMVLPPFLLGMMFLPWKKPLFLVIGATMILAGASQPIEMIRKKTIGAAEIRLTIVYLASSLFWTIYGIAIRDAAVFLLSVGSLIIFVVTILCWFRYRIASP